MHSNSNSNSNIFQVIVNSNVILLPIIDPNPDRQGYDQCVLL